MPMCFVRLLKHWYNETLVQTKQIKWAKHLSEPFHVSNGLRQGGVLSPYLFGVYLNVIQTVLLQLKIIPCDSAYAWHTSSILCNQRTLGQNTQISLANIKDNITPCFNVFWFIGQII